MSAKVGLQADLGDNKMVQVLPAVPSFGEQLAEILTQAGANIGQGLVKRATRLSDLKITEKLNDPKTSYQDKQTLWSKLSPEAREIQKPFLEADLRAAEAQKKEDIKKASSDLEKKEKSEVVLSTVEDMRKLIPYTGSTKIPFTSSFNAGPGGLNRTGLEKRSEFDTLAASAASFFRDLETKGQLPQGLFEQVVKPRLPSSELSERENRGRLNGLEALAKKYGGLEKKAAKEEVRLQKVEKGTKITEDIAKQILSQANGDKEKARELAKGLGYEF